MRRKVTWGRAVSNRLSAMQSEMPFMVLFSGEPVALVAVPVYAHWHQARGLKMRERIISALFSNLEVGIRAMCHCLVKVGIIDK